MDIVSALYANMQQQMLYFADKIPTMHLLPYPDVCAVYSDVANDTFNYVLDAQLTSTSVDQRIDAIIANYHERALPFSWWVSPDRDHPSDLKEHLERKGFTYSEENLGMSLDLEQYRPIPLSFPIVRVLNEKQLKSFAELLIAVWLSPECYSQIYQQIPLELIGEKAPMEFYLLFDEEGRAVTTGILFFHADVAGIYYLATHPAQRRRGYGGVMMHALLQRALQRGYKWATLPASEEGKGLYTRLGFTPCTRITEYAPPPA